MSKPTALRKIDDASALRELQALWDSFPKFQGDISDDERRWLGRVHAIVDEIGVSIDSIVLTTTVLPSLANTATRPGAIGSIKDILSRAIAQVERSAPASATGAFLPAGSPSDAFATVARIVREAAGDVLFVDPYMNSAILTDSLSPSERVLIRLLAAREKIKDDLRPAQERWRAQYGDARPVEVRLAPKSLHDRSIQVDRKAVWIVTQSFNAIASKAPASFSLMEGAAAAEKLEAYEQIWGEAEPI
jgi:enamine deaminase RidA (YjgF/YER057c/UK114 family)